MIDEGRMVERRERKRGYVAGGRGKPPSGKERGYNCDKLFQNGETASQMKIRLYPLLIERPQSRDASKSKGIMLMWNVNVNGNVLSISR